MDYKVEWRVTYKRTMSDRRLRGYGTGDAFKFFDDNELGADYAAFLEYKMLPGSPWTIFCRILIDQTKTNYILIDCNGDKILQDNSYIKKNIFNIFLKNQKPTPRQFLSVVRAKEKYFEIYKT